MNVNNKRTIVDVIVEEESKIPKNIDPIKGIDFSRMSNFSEFEGSNIKSFDIRNIEKISSENYDYLIEERENSSHPFILAIVKSNKDGQDIYQAYSAEHLNKWIESDGDQANLCPFTKNFINNIYYYSIDKITDPSFNYLTTETFGVENKNKKFIKLVLDNNMNPRPESMYDLSLEYSNRSEILNHKKIAFKWLLSAATLSHKVAQRELAQCYEEGKGTEINKSEAFRWYLTAAENGDPIAQLKLGKCFEKGLGTEVNYEKAFFWYSKSASNGNLKAEIEVGRCHVYGIGKCHRFFGIVAPEDKEKAFQIFSKESLAENPLALEWLGDCYMHGIGTERNTQKGMNSYFKSFKLGHAPSAYKLAQYTTISALYQKLNETEKNVRKLQAFNYFSDALKLGEKTAIVDLIFCYLEGYGTEKNEKEAAKLMLKAVNSKDPDILHLLGVQYEFGTNINTTINLDTAFKCFMEAYKLGRQSDLYALVKFDITQLRTDSNKEAAFKLFSELASQPTSPKSNFAKAQLSKCYVNGIGTAVNFELAFRHFLDIAISDEVYFLQNIEKRTYFNDDYKEFIRFALNKLGDYYSEKATKQDNIKAYDCYLKSAALGDVNAMVNLGICYLRGLGTNGDEKKAYNAFFAAAEQGSIKAYYYLGFCYLNRIGTDNNENRAFYYFSIAAKNGNEKALYELGNCFLNGIGTAVSYEDAYLCFSESAKKGHSLSKSALEQFPSEYLQTQQMDLD